jgi:predicted secreted hydrolase
MSQHEHHHPRAAAHLAPSIPPCPPADFANHLPKDHYLHTGAPTEWWWIIGTLKAGARTFGFEINAAHLMTYFSQVMLTDVANNAHYQQTKLQLGAGPDWAQSDPSKDWTVQLGNPSTDDSWITMHAPQATPTQNMAIKAAFVDAKTQKPVRFDLVLSQKSEPIQIWGTGVTAPPMPPTVETNNYYYSLTRCETHGTVTFDGETFPVEGLTWMDHEYGLFGSSSKPVKWFLQAVQLSDGIHISHSVSFPDAPPAKGVPTPSSATIQLADGTIYFDKHCTLTPLGDPWINKDTGAWFFLEFQIEIPSCQANLIVKSLVAEQDFPFPGGIADTYEGVASATGTFLGEAVHGTAWNEQQP